MKRIADIPSEDRPREKLQLKGAKALSDVELLAILIGMGNAKHDVMTLAVKVLKSIDNNGGIPDLEQLQKIEGIGLAKAALITAAIEFTRRRIRPEGTKVRFIPDLLPLLTNYADRKQEHLLCISLNGAQEVITTRVVTIGLADKTMIHPREVFADPITDRAIAIILAHNHPSGLPEASSADIIMTKKIADAGMTLGIKLLDHVIFNSRGYFSFEEKGLLEP
jgi:DNA repair protein RadC